jgi:mannitol/fructose-specific phosphotransferase system IIA component (Ntr-type)
MIMKLRHLPCAVIGAVEIPSAITDFSTCIEHVLGACPLGDLPRPTSPSEIRDAFVFRENQMSTAIGRGYATPEADLAAWDVRFRIIVAWSRTPMAWWDSLDGEPVWIALCCIIPSPRPTMPLQVIKHLYRRYLQTGHAAERATAGGDHLLMTMAALLDHPTDDFRPAQ